MKQRPVVREETDADVAAIAEVTRAAFEALEISQKTEAHIIEALRAAEALTVSLVAEAEGRVVGHVAFSPVDVSDGSRDWYGLGPVSVRPDHQRRGVGRALISEGLARLKALGARGCCLVGHPGYYERFGFENTPDLVYEGVPPEAFFALSFAGPVPKGRVTFHEAFKADGKPEGGGGASTMESDRYARGWRRLKEVDPQAGERLTEALRDIAPDLARYTIEFPFGDVYSRSVLSLREREIATVAALAALGNAQPQLKVHIHGALNVGCTRPEVVEILIQMAVYAGFPAAINAMFAAKEVFAERDRDGLS